MGAKHPTHRIIRASVFPSYRHREGSRIHPALNAEIPQEIESKFRRGFQPRAFVWSHTTMPSAMAPPRSNPKEPGLCCWKEWHNGSRATSNPRYLVKAIPCNFSSALSSCESKRPPFCGCTILH